MIKDALQKLADRANLTELEADTVMGEIMDGTASAAQIAAYLMGLRMKGETVEEIAGSVQAMRARATKIRVGDSQVVDTCGTGGDGAHTFNISTTAAFVVAGAGLTVAKHGNRSVSSKCGSADVFAALGVQIDLPPERVADCVNEVGIGFLFAPLYHGAMKHCAVPRQELGIRTLLNILGPLTNPAGARLAGRRRVRCRIDRAIGQSAGAFGCATLLCRPWHGWAGRDHVDGSNQNFRRQGGGGLELSCRYHRSSACNGSIRRSSSAAARKTMRRSPVTFFEGGRDRNATSSV